jgi:plasmid replication initiation protein
MAIAPRRRPPSRAIILDRALESLPIFRLSDSASEDVSISYTPAEGRRWRVLPNPGDRLPGTFDQDVYVELWHRFTEAGFPSDGVLRFTLHAFLRSMGKRVDGRTYEQLRSSLARLNHTRLESSGSYYDAASQSWFEGQLSLLGGVAIDRKRSTDRDQLQLFPALNAAEPGVAQVTLSAVARANVEAGYTIQLLAPLYGTLTSPVARRLYRLLEVARAEGSVTWRVGLDELAEQLPLAQRYPSHLQRVLQPAHEMLIGAGILRDVQLRQNARSWLVDYVLGSRSRVAAIG